MGRRIGEYREYFLVASAAIAIFFVGFSFSYSVLAARDLAKGNTESVLGEQDVNDEVGMTTDQPIDEKEDVKTDETKQVERSIANEKPMIVGYSEPSGINNMISTPIPGSVQMNEQFDGNSLNSNLWEAMTYPRAYRNEEEQEYKSTQVKVSDGNLQITAERDGRGNWASGIVESKWAFAYGEFEVRLKLSSTGQGVWPAAWLMGRGAEWPKNGEIDIFENVNGNPVVYGTIHGGGSMYHWQLQHSYSSIDIQQYHTYKIVKQPGYIGWWIDDIKRAEWVRSQLPEGAEWPFEDFRYYSLLNLAMGGTWPGSTNASTPNTITMYVDSFKVTNGR